MRVDRRWLLHQGIGLGLGAGAVWLVRDLVLWPAPTVAAKGPLDWLPFAYRRTTLATVEVSAFGARFNALIDSGAQRSALDRSFADRLGLEGRFPLPMVAYGVSGQPQLGNGLRFDMTVGGLAAKGLTAAVLELGPIAGADGLSSPLIIGQDLLSLVAAEIDYPRRRVRLLPAQGYAPPGAHTLADAERRGRGLYANILLGEAPVRALVDTGASAALSLKATSPVAAGLPASGRSEQSVVLGGVMTSRVVEGQSLAFAGRRFDGVEVHVHDGGGPPGAPDAILGAELLAGSAVSLDLGRGRLALIDV